MSTHPRSPSPTGARRRRRLWPASLALLLACSRGAAPEEGDLAPGPATEADMGASSPDLRPAQAAMLVPVWLRTIQGGLTLWGPYVAAAPTAKEGAPVTVVAAFTKGYALDKITIGAGEPGAAEIAGAFKPVLLWLDGRDGKLQRVRQAAADQAPGQRASVVPQAGLSVDATGAAVLGGQFHGSAVFNPGTAAERAAATESRLNGDTLDRAEDPFVLRYGADTQPGWMARGRTPGPLTKTWFNYCQGVAALSDGGALAVGVFEDSGFIFGDGTAGAATLRAAGGSYLARIGPTGSPAWVARHAGTLSFWPGVRAAADGAAYLLATFSDGATLLADAPTPVRLVAEAGRRNYAVIKVTPAGAVAWVRRIAADDGSNPIDFAVTPDGRVVVSGYFKGKLDLLPAGAGPADASRESPAPQGFVASWGADGALAWLTPLGAEVDFAGPLALGKGGEAWLGATTAAATRAVPLDEGGPAPLPQVMAAADATFTLLYRISPAGRRAGAAVVGVNVPVSRLAAAADGGLVLTGVYGDWLTDARVGAKDGGSQALPACDPMADQRIFLLGLAPRTLP